MNVVWTAIDDDLEGSGRIGTVYMSVMSPEEVQHLVSADVSLVPLCLADFQPSR